MTKKNAPTVVNVRVPNELVPKLDELHALLKKDARLALLGITRGQAGQMALTKGIELMLREAKRKG